MKSSNKNKLSREGASYISKSAPENSPEIEKTLNFKLTNFIKKHTVIFGGLVVLFTAVIGPLIADGLKYSIRNYTVRNPELILKSYMYERETPKHKVYSVIFTINNSGNQDISLQQAIPYDTTGAVNFLQNNSCESNTGFTVEKGQLKDFKMHVFMPKNLIELMKNLEKNSKYSTMINSQGEVQNARSLHSQVLVAAKVFIYTDNKLLNAVLTFELPYKLGDELNAEGIGKTTDFKVTNDSLYKCPIREVTE